MNFDIDPEYLTSVTVRQVYYRAKDPSNPTPEELFAIIKDGPISMTSTGSDDHPEFKLLRNKLEKLGYIKCERSWWNGDRVLKPFTINKMLKFKKNEQFSCGSAMGITWKIVQEKRKK